MTPFQTLLMAGEDSLSSSNLFAPNFFTALSSGDRTLDLKGAPLVSNGGMIYERAQKYTGSNYFTDTLRGKDKYLPAHGTGGEFTSTTRIRSIADGQYVVNAANWPSGTLVGSMVFCNHPGFFYVKRYTGNGLSNRIIPTGLTAPLGFSIIRKLSSGIAAICMHRSIGNDRIMNFDSSFDTYTGYFRTENSNLIAQAAVGQTNELNSEYVVYSWAHNPDMGVICDSFVGTRTVTLPWKPRLVLVKGIASSTQWVSGIDTPTGNSWSDYNMDVWWAYDASVGLAANLFISETGFTVSTALLPDMSKAVMYLAIR